MKTDIAILKSDNPKEYYMKILEFYKKNYSQINFELQVVRKNEHIFNLIEKKLANVFSGPYLIWN